MSPVRVMNRVLEYDLYLITLLTFTEASLYGHTKLLLLQFPIL